MSRIVLGACRVSFHGMEIHMVYPERSEPQAYQCPRNGCH